MTEHSADQGSEANDQADKGPSIVPGLSDMASTRAKEPGKEPEKASAGAAAEVHGPVNPGNSEATRNPSNIMILWPERPEASTGRSFAEDDTFARRQGARASLRRRRTMAMAAVVAVAAICGAAGGSLATLALGHASTPQQQPKVAAVDETAPLRDAVARVTADVSGLKADLDRTGKARAAQISKFGERLDKMEKSQDDTAMRVAKIGDAQEKMQDKLRTASAAPETTGSIAATPAKTDASKKLAVVDGWTLNRVSNGGAIVDGPMGRRWPAQST